jgi:hypothetical protein
MMTMSGAHFILHEISLGAVPTKNWNARTGTPRRSSRRGPSRPEWRASVVWSTCHRCCCRCSSLVPCLCSCERRCANQRKSEMNEEGGSMIKTTWIVSSANATDACLQPGQGQVVHHLTPSFTDHGDEGNAASSSLTWYCWNWPAKEDDDDPSQLPSRNLCFVGS